MSSKALDEALAKLRAQSQEVDDGKGFALFACGCAVAAFAACIWPATLIVVAWLVVTHW